MKKSSGTIKLTLFFFFFWLLLSGHYDLFHMVVGLFCSIGLAFWYRPLFAYKFFSDQFNPYPMRKIFFFTKYIFWLLWQIFLSALAVSRAVFNLQKIDPQLIKFSADLKTTASRVILGNSITLTPGTVTILLDDQHYLVHGLMNESVSSLIDGSFQTMVARIHERNPENILKSVEVIKSRRRL